MPKSLEEARAELTQSFADMRAANDAALEQKADKGYAEGLVKEALAKADSAIDRAIARIDSVERRLEVEGAHGGSDSEKAEAQHIEELAATTGRVITPEQFREYRAAHNRLIRVGEQRLTHAEMAALSVGSDPNGGYFVLPDTSGRIVRKIFESSPIRQYAGQVTISTDAYEGMYEGDEPGVGWVGETASRPETSTATAEKWRIPVHEMYAEPKATQKLLDDAAVDIEGWHAGKVSAKFTREENTQFVLGNGVMKPRGFMTYTAVTTDDGSRPRGEVQYVPTGAAGAFASSDPGDALIDLIFSMKDHYDPSLFMNRLTEAAVRKLKDGDGNYLWQPDFTSPTNRSVVGVPVVRAQDMPAMAADSLSVALADLGEAYIIVDRIGIRVLRDPFTAKPYVKFYTTKRVGGDVVDFEALKYLKFAAS